jgi:hypothetical protein
MRVGWDWRSEMAVEEVEASIAGRAAEKTDAEELIRYERVQLVCGM